MNKIIYRLRTAVMLLCAALMLTACVHEDEPDIRSVIADGDPLPRFEVDLSDGTHFSSESPGENGSLILFFTTGCPDCQRVLPLIQQTSLMSPLTRIVAISRAEGEEAVAAYWRENSLTLPYSAQKSADIYRLFATAGIPRVYIADREGRVVAQYYDREIPVPAVLASALWRLYSTGNGRQCDPGEKI